MTNEQYRRLTKQQLRGRKVKTLRPLETALGRLDVGRVLTIEGKQGGLELLGPKCWSCGVQMRILKVEPQAVELLPLGTGF